MNTKQSPLCRGGGAERQLKSIFDYNTNKNPLARLEKERLQKCLFYGELLRFSYSFADNRNKLIYSNLESFLNCFPCDQYSCTWFIYYLQDTGAIDLCGGADYVRGVFYGIGEAHE
jgi:hypothetical protein